MYEELSVVQESATKSMGSQGVSVPESGQTVSTRREGRNYPKARQKQSRSQDTDTIQPPNYERLNKKASVSRSFPHNSPESLQQKVPAAKKGHRLKSVELPPKPKINHQPLNQSLQVKT